MPWDERALVFAPNVHKALWGGESWEISVHPDGPGVVASGPLAGRSLRELEPDFSLLVKVIDARTRLSVQVHPNELTRLVTGGEAKTELWCLLSDGFIYAGLKPGTSPSDIEAAIHDGSFERLMVRHDVKKGDVFFIPGGLVHSIGDGTCIYEVQQNSNTTFRLYDWNRVGADGKPRTLHLDQARTAIDYTLPPPEAVERVTCPFFSFSRERIDGSLRIGGAHCTALYAFRGSFSLGGKVYGEGSSVLVRAGDDFDISGDGAEVLVTSARP